MNSPESRWPGEMSAPSHKGVQWDQPPTYNGDFISFSGALMGQAVLSSETLSEAPRDSYQNFHLYSVKTPQFGGIESSFQTK